MGLLDQIGGMLGGAATGCDTNNTMLQSALELVQNYQGGGLAGLVDAFKNKGMGDIASSWVGTGENQAIDASQLEQVLGNDTIQQIAAKTGLSPDMLSQGLASVLPQVIDKLTPNGTLPEGGLLEEGLSLLKGKFFG